MFRALGARRTTRVAIVGGGLSGLTAALRCADEGYRVTLFEAGKRLGGSVWTERDGDFLIEHGTQSFDPSGGAIRELAAELDLTREICAPSASRSYGFDGRSLFVLDPGRSSALSATTSAIAQSEATFRAGMGQLVDALATNLAPRAELVLDSPVRRLDPTATGWRLESTRGAGGEFDAIIIASQARTASRLLREFIGAPALALETSRSVPIVSVSLAFERHAIAHALDATGFVTGFGVELDDCLKCSFVSSTFAGRAPDGSVLLRAFLRPQTSELETPLEVFRERATRALTRVLRARGAPQRSWEARWRDGFTVFDEQHALRVARLESAIGRLPIALSGAAFHGVGIDAAVRSAANAVRKLRRLR